MPMKRVILAISDHTDGGAAVACRRLVEALRARGNDRVIWLAMAGRPGVSDILLSDWPGLPGVLLHRLSFRFKSAGNAILGNFFARCRTWGMERDALRMVRRLKPDLVHLHNIHAASFRLAERLPAGLPLVWTLHDIWLLTGYCVYSYECQKYADGCRGECPQSGKWGEASFPPDREWNRRQRFFRRNRDRIVLVSPSRWLAECAARRFGALARVEQAPYGVPLAVFKPVDRAKAREVLGLPGRRPVILTGACSLDETRKGAAFLSQAVNRLRPALAPVVVAFGAPPRSTPLPEGWLFPGTIHDEELLNLYYNAADVYALPSMADNLPNTLIESLAAGTPCATFDTGGCADVVRDGVTGYVAKRGDVEDLARCLSRLLDRTADDKETMRQNCRRIATEEYGIESQGTRYEAIYGQLLRPTGG